MYILDHSPLDGKTAVQEICDRVELKIIEVKHLKENGGDFRGWNIYLCNISLKDEDHILLIKLIRASDFLITTLGYGIPLQGKGTLYL